MNTIPIDTVTFSVGLLVARVVIGLMMAAHGSQKLFGWFGGHGLAGTAGFFDSLGFRPGRLFATLASGTEITSGLLVAFGLFGPVGPALMISVMISAAVSNHWKNGVFAGTNGIEVPMLYGVIATALLLTGPGLYSLDAALGLGALSTPVFQWSLLVIGVVGGISNLLVRRPVVA